MKLQIASGSAGVSYSIETNMGITGCSIRRSDMKDMLCMCAGCLLCEALHQHQHQHQHHLQHQSGELSMSTRGTEEAMAAAVQICPGQEGTYGHQRTEKQLCKSCCISTGSDSTIIWFTKSPCKPSSQPLGARTPLPNTRAMGTPEPPSSSLELCRS